MICNENSPKCVKKRIGIFFVVTLCCTILFSYFSYTNYKKLHLAISSYERINYTLIDIRRAESFISSYLTSVDLILGSDQTYLLHSALGVSANIKDILMNVDNSSLPKSMQQSLETSIDSILNIDNIIKKASYLNNDYENQIDREKVLTGYLYKVDNISKVLVSTIPLFKEYLSQDVKNNSNNIERLKANIKLTIAILFSIYAILLFALWVWLSRGLDSLFSSSNTSKV